MKTASKLLRISLLLALAMGPVLTPTRAAEPASGNPPAATEKTVVITANDALRFSVTKIEATPGERIHVQLRDEGTLPKESMGHNWILLDKDSEALPYAMAALSDRAGGYQPKSLASHVLAEIPLLGAKEIGNVTFNAPAKPGNYPFICSFPGHLLAGMRGELVVQ